MLGQSSRAGVSTGDIRHPLPSPTLFRLFSPRSMAAARPVRCREVHTVDVRHHPSSVRSGHGRHRRNPCARGRADLSPSSSKIHAGQVTTGDLLIRPEPPFPSCSGNIWKCRFLCVSLPPKEVRSKFIFRNTKRSVTGSRSANLKLALTPWPLASSQPKTGAGEAVKIRRDPRLRRPPDFGVNRKTDIR